MFVAHERHFIDWFQVGKQTDDVVCKMCNTVCNQTVTTCCRAVFFAVVSRKDFVYLVCPKGRAFVFACMYRKEYIKKTRHVTLKQYTLTKKHKRTYTQINMWYSMIVKIDVALCAEVVVGLLLEWPSLLMKTFYGNRDKRFSFDVFSFTGDPCEWWFKEWLWSS